MGIRFIVAIIVGLLFCTLATLEFPELLTLSDDTWNDYSLELCQGATSDVVERQADSPQAAVVGELERNIEVDHSVLPVGRYRSLCDASDFLPLLCIRRT
ncbi:MAG: hypothetical protein ABSA57_03835 [Candidatus Acidiferrales bacterium]|jgi:hypothetical protein